MTASWRIVLRREVAGARRLVVLGVGAPGSGDDAAGSFCARALRRELRGRQRGRIRVFDTAEVPEGATGPIRRFGPALVILVDAALSNRRPGAVFIVRREDVAFESPTTHTIPLRYLMAYLEESVGCRAFILGIQPRRVSFGKDLSAPVRAAALAVSGEILSALTMAP